MRMKTVKSIIRLLTVVLICISLTACVGKNKELPKQEPSQDERDSELYDPYFTDETPIPEDDGGREERERMARERERDHDEDSHRIGASEEDDGGREEREREAREQDKQEQKRRQQEEEERRRQEEEEEEPDDCIGPELIGYPIDVPDEERDDDGQDEQDAPIGWQPGDTNEGDNQDERDQDDQAEQERQRQEEEEENQQQPVKYFIDAGYSEQTSTFPGDFTVDDQ